MIFFLWSIGYLEVHYLIFTCLYIFQIIVLPICNLIILWLKNMLYDFNSLKFIESCFMI